MNSSTTRSRSLNDLCGATAAEQFAAGAFAESAEAWALPAHAQMVHLDDSKTMRALVSRAVTAAFPGLDIRSFEETRGLVDHVLAAARHGDGGACGACGAAPAGCACGDSKCAAPAVLFVVLDQNLGAAERPGVKGSDVAKELRLRGYTGVIVALTTDNEDRGLYEKAGYDAVIGKPGFRRELKAVLLGAFRKRAGGFAPHDEAKVAEETSEAGNASEGTSYTASETEGTSETVSETEGTSETADEDDGSVISATTCPAEPDAADAHDR